MADVKYNNCNDKMAVLRNELVPRKLEVFDEIKDGTEILDEDYVYINRGRDSKRIKAGLLKDGKFIQTDWNEKSSTSAAFIKNKPGCDNLEEDRVCLYDIGGIKAGHMFEKGTSIRDILDMMLSFNDRGYFLTKVIDYEPELLTVQELRAIDRDERNRVPVSDEVWINGYDWSVEMDNNYFLVAVKDQGGKEVSVKEITQSGFTVDLVKEVFNDGEFTVWYFNQPSKGKFVLKVKVKDGE